MTNENRGSWQERQIVDRDETLLHDDDARAKREFWMPLIFYLFAFLVRFPFRPSTLPYFHVQFFFQKKNTFYFQYFFLGRFYK